MSSISSTQNSGGMKTAYVENLMVENNRAEVRGGNTKVKNAGADVRGEKCRRKG